MEHTSLVLITKTPVDITFFCILVLIKMKINLGEVIVSMVLEITLMVFIPSRRDTIIYR